MKDLKLKDIIFLKIHYILQTTAKGLEMGDYLVLLKILRTLMKGLKLKDFIFLKIHYILQTTAKGLEMDDYLMLLKILRTLMKGLKLKPDLEVGPCTKYTRASTSYLVLVLYFSQYEQFRTAKDSPVTNFSIVTQIGFTIKTNVLLLVKVIKPVYFKNVFHYINLEHRFLPSNFLEFRQYLLKSCHLSFGVGVSFGTLKF